MREFGELGEPGDDVPPGSAGAPGEVARALYRPDADDVPALPRMAEALAAGEVNREHVDAAVRA